MIPKVIHYCWFGGGPLSKLNIQCINSWKKHLPDYEIKEWNETNFDVNVVPYTQEAYRAKRWAFVSDYARFWILYNHGGIYLDTDVEIIHPIDDIVEAGDYMGCEASGCGGPFYVAPGLGFGCHKGNQVLKELLDIYSTLHFDLCGKQNLKSIVYYTTEYLVKAGAKNVNEIQVVKDFVIYPKEYFNPWDATLDRYVLTPKTRSIHHYEGSWFTRRERFMKFVEKKVGRWAVRLIHALYVSIKSVLLVQRNRNVKVH